MKLDGPTTRRVMSNVQFPASISNQRGSMIEKHNRLVGNNIILLTCLLFLIFVYPAVSRYIPLDLAPAGFQILVRSLVFTAIVLSGAYSLDFRKKTRGLLLGAGFVTIFLIWLNYYLEDEITRSLFFLSYFFFNLFITVFLIRHIAQSKNVTVNIILSSINGYLLLGLLGALLLFPVGVGGGHFAGNASNGFFEFLYLSFVTLSTLGYGDITPVSPLAKSITLAIAICGQLYLTILIAMLVGKFLSQGRSEQQ